jgi:hypothetical protein
MASNRTALVIAMSSIDLVRLSVDVSIESVNRQSPDGFARTLLRSARSCTPPFLSGAYPGASVQAERR